MAHDEGVIVEHPPDRGSRRGWALWSAPSHAVALILLVEASALAGLVAALYESHPHLPTVMRFVTLCVLSAIFSEAVHHSERVRSYLVGSGLFVDAATVWTIAAVVALPPGWAALTTVVVYAPWLLRSQGERVRPPHRVIYTGATVVLAVLAGRFVLTYGYDGLTALPSGPRYLIALALAVAACEFVNYALVYAVIYVASRPSDWRPILPGRDEVVFEYVTLILGVFTGEILVARPWLTPGVLAILALLYRGAMVTKLKLASSTDQKTGLLNFAAWKETTARALTRTARAREPIALMLVDLDHFKLVNDAHGHLVGDRLLVAVADCLRAEMRACDAVGRFGGEEFVIFLNDTDLHASVAAAERLRTRIGQLVVADHAQVTASIGIAYSPRSTDPLETLLERADTALYQAKAGGRDQVRAVSAVVGAPRTVA